MASTNGVAKKLLFPEQINIEDLTGDEIYTTSRGIKIRITPVPVDTILEARRRVPVPKAPEIPVEGEPGKYDVNYMHPKYIEEMDEYNRVIQLLSFQVMAAYGVTAYAVPSDRFGPDDDGWVEMLAEDEIFAVDGQSYAMHDIPGKDKPRARFAAWLRLYALGQNDVLRVQDAFMHGVGVVKEEDVETAVESFPGGEGRTSDSGGSKAVPRK